ncbi:MAG: DNA repair protein RadC [Gammaproteobacteria bacterium]|nr:DNA repair protein RadC [Gammaproteobacteria bacterium]
MEKDLPREKLLKYGRSSLTDDEVLSLLIGSGTKDINVFDLSKMIMDELMTFSNLEDLNVTDLMHFKGVGLSKACTIISALELSKRLRLNKINKTKLLNPKDIIRYVYGDYLNVNYEILTCIYLDKERQIISKYSLKSSSNLMIEMNLNELLRRALIVKAHMVILIHNHPSGNITPSESDLYNTNEFGRKLAGFKIELIDHYVIYEKTYYSIRFKMKGKIK